MPTLSTIAPRQVALAIVDTVTQSEKEIATDWLDQHFRRFSIPWRDRALITEIVYGTLRRLITLDWILSRYTFHRVKDHLLKNILRLGTYQIHFLEKVPTYAVVDEMVQITKEKMGEAKARFVNAVLRRVAAREISLTEEGVAKVCGRKGLEVLSVLHGMPQWLLERWEKDYSAAQIRQICMASNATPAIYARVNKRKVQRDQLLEMFRSEGVAVQKCAGSGMFKIRPQRSIESLPSYRQGFFFIQDPTTVGVIDFMGPKPTDMILDYCAAPGGKAFAIEDRTGKGENIVAVEIHSERLRLAMENTHRLGSTVQWMAPDALRYKFNGKFDKILLDVPCSNLGVMSRRVEVRLRLAPEKIERLVKMQSEILEQALAWICPGGSIFYSTCSIDPAENERRVEEFVQRHKGWVCTRKRTTLPEAGQFDGGFVAELAMRIKG